MLEPQGSSPNVSATLWDAEVRETHSGLVLLTGDRAYKVKKPVNLGFLDFTSCSAREGAKVLVTDFNDESGSAVANGVTEAGGGATFFHHDVTSLW